MSAAARPDRKQKVADKVPREDQASRITLSKRDFVTVKLATPGSCSPNAALQRALKEVAKSKRA